MNHQTDSLQEDKVTSHENTSEAEHSTLSPSVVSTAATSEPSHMVAESASPELGDSGELSRQLPIPPASEPKQYRAIGLIYGKYVPSETQFTRGNLITEDGISVDSVLLGRVMSLVKKHIDLEKAHLWVVYPRTRNKDQYLHAQIVGVWEPEKLNRPLDEAGGEDGEENEPALNTTGTSNEVGDSSVESSESSASSSDNESSDNESSDSEIDALESGRGEVADSAKDVSSDSGAFEVSTPESDASIAPSASSSSEKAETESLQPDKSESGQEQAAMELKKPAKPALFSTDDQEMLKDGYFSIRGEVIKVSEDDGEVTVKIRQAPRKGTTQQRSFNVVLKGSLEGRVTGYFWDLNVQRNGTDLVIQDGTMIGIVLPKKKSKNSSSPRGRGGASGKRRWNNRSNHGDRPEKPDGPRRQPISKNRKASVDKPQPDPKTT